MNFYFYTIETKFCFDDEDESKYCWCTQGHSCAMAFKVADEDIETPSDFLSYLEDALYYEGLAASDYFQENVELDTKYYIISDNNDLVGVFEPHVGYCFIDCMEHDDRMIVKSEFPHINCGTIGEDEHFTFDI